MKLRTYTLLLLLIGLSANLSAQQGFTFYFENDDTSKTATTSANVDFYGHVINQSNAALTSRWSVRNQNFPNSNWTFTVCDDNICYAPGVASQAQTTQPGDTSLVKVTMMSDGTGIGSLDISVTDENNGAETASFTLTLDATTTSADQLAQVVTLTQNAPNPFHGFTTVFYDLKGHNGHLTITDLTGRHIAMHRLDASGQVQIGQDLPTGIYLYTLHVDGRAVVSKRLQKL